MKSMYIAPATMMLGLFFLALSFVLPAMNTSQNRWTEEKSIQKHELNAKLHALSHVHGNHNADGKATHADDQHSSGQFAQVKRERIQLQEELTDIQQGARRSAALWKWSGISLMAVGVVIYLARKQHNKS